MSEGERETGDAIQYQSRDQGGAEGEMAPDRPTDDAEDVAAAVDREEAQEKIEGE